VIVDPFGHRWMLLRRPARATRLRQGDVANVTMVARDARRAREFYEAVLQVPFSAGHRGAWRTNETRPPLGIWSPEDAEPQVQLSYRVDDIAAAVERVRAAGGHADEPERDGHSRAAKPGPSPPLTASISITTSAASAGDIRAERPSAAAMRIIHPSRRNWARTFSLPGPSNMAIG
jgi:predicted enzyme related to lactoylglutathione lyase